MTSAKRPLWRFCRLAPRKPSQGSRDAIIPDEESCGSAIAVGDAWQRKGVGHRLMSALLHTARERRLKMMEGEVLAANHRILALPERLSFTAAADATDPSIRRIAKRLA
ncbi:MAG: GNAT family N-acetyltransferase [Betaproteobacteria bacterium]|nr:GNAT family N-acetyltransferase [Betaproteobacteria bacterium]